MTKTTGHPIYKDSGVAWQPTVRKSWQIATLGGLYRTVDVRAGSAADESNLLSVSQTKGVVPRSEISADAARAEDLSHYKTCIPGDIVLNRMSAYKGALGVSSQPGIVSPDYLVMRVSPKANAHFIAHFLKTPNGIAQMSSRLRGIGSADLGTVRTPRLNHGDLRSIPMLVPSRREQDSIVEFLDRETAKIDALIGKQEQLIKTLRERRMVVIANAVSEPFGSDWVRDKLGRRARIGNGSTPRREEPEFWAGGDFPWLNSSAVNQDVVDAADQFVTSTALRQCHLPIVPPGSLLVGLTGEGRTRGMATLLAMESTVSQHVAYVIPEPVWLPTYLLWALRASYQSLRALSDENGSTKGGLTCGDLKAMRISRPPLDQQRQIAERLRRETLKIDILIERGQRFIELSKERRAALISAAVTGQIDVRRESDFDDSLAAAHESMA